MLYLNDNQGTPQKLISSTGQVVWAATYDSFGQAVIEIETVTNNLRLPGQYFDAETGLHSNWHRYYDPTLGRYLATDPLGQAAGLNLYAYVHNSPLAMVDPQGLAAQIASSVGTALGTITGNGIAQGLALEMNGGDFLDGFKVAALSYATSTVTAAGFDFAGDLLVGVSNPLAQAGIHLAMGAATGAINAAITGTDVGQGALLGGLSAGGAKLFGETFGCYLPDNHLSQMASRAIVGGIIAGVVSDENGDTFFAGFMYGANVGIMAYMYNDGEALGPHSNGETDGTLRRELQKAKYNFAAATMMAVLCPGDFIIGEVLFGTLTLLTMGLETILYSPTPTADMSKETIKRIAAIPPGTPLGVATPLVNRGKDMFIDATYHAIRDQQLEHPAGTKP
ncbi:MAG: RHS repeat-associated core domain-containing protein [Thermodesulfobacteriota bacterium]